jgi:hypothetical protein
MVILELGQVIHIAVDSDIQAVGLVVRRHVGGCEDFGHGAGWEVWETTRGGVVGWKGRNEIEGEVEEEEAGMRKKRTKVGGCAVWGIKREPSRSSDAVGKGDNHMPRPAPTGSLLPQHSVPSS